MSEPFDPYRKWLGIPPQEQPPDYYRLLGIAQFESDPDVIENAANRQMAHVRTFQTGKHSAQSQHLLNELALAKRCLLNPARKAEYDAGMHRQPPTPAPPVAIPPAEAPADAVPADSDQSVEAATPPPAVTPSLRVQGRRAAASTASRARAHRRPKSIPWAMIGLVTLGVVLLLVMIFWLTK